MKIERINAKAREHGLMIRGYLVNGKYWNLNVSHFPKSDFDCDIQLPAKTTWRELKMSVKSKGFNFNN